MKIAVVHDWLTTFTGAEHVLSEILRVYPDANLFCLLDFLPRGDRAFLDDVMITTSFMQHLPLVRKHYRNYLPIMPFAIEQFDLSQYDLVISSSFAVAKGIISSPNQLHVSYMHSPMRYAWDLTHQYMDEARLRNGPKALIVKAMLHKIRQWDSNSANGVDSFIANSCFISRRIWKVYRRFSTVIYPPVDTSAFTPTSEKEDFYLTASRMVPYKKLDIIVEAFSKMPNKRLVVIGDGPDYKKVKSIAGANVELLGFQPFEVLRDHLQRAKAFIFAAQEDFGIIAVEAQACGTPVLAYGKGGALETVVQNQTGLFFNEQTSQAITEIVHEFESRGSSFDAIRIRQNSERFSAQRFREEFSRFVDSQWQRFELGLTENSSVY